MKFYKYEATQNDFILTLNQTFTSEEIQKLCDVHQKIGADGVINITHLREITIYNQDGSPAHMCGNGLRCVSHLLYELTAQKKHIVTINNHEYALNYLSPDTAEVILPIPSMVKKKSSLLNGYFIDVKNLHYVILVDDIKNFIFDDQIKNFSTENHCNIEIVSIQDANTLNMRVYEYGVGETRSCGSGAIAAFYLLRQFHMLDAIANIHLPGGTLKIADKNDFYVLTGPVHYLYTGELQHEA